MKAMIFAAGIGSRLGDITRTTPKCLVDVGGRPMLEHVIGQLKRAGVTSVVINLHHLGEQIEAFIRSKDSFGIAVDFSREPTLLGTGGGLKHAARFFRGAGDFFVHNSDIFSDLDLRALLSQHQKARAVATLAVMHRDTSRYLIFDREGSLVGWENPGGKGEVIEEKRAEARQAFSGIQVVSESIFEFMEEDTGDFSIITTYMKAARRGKPIMSFDMSATYWMDMGSPQKLEELRRHVDALK